jgi:hypothetical protein
LSIWPLVAGNVQPSAGQNDSLLRRIAIAASPALSRAEGSEIGLRNPSLKLISPMAAMDLSIHPDQ